MKANELIFGDWIICNNIPSKIVNIISEENDIADIENNKEYGTFYISKMQPIPITPEILEKNNFTLEKYITDYEEYVSENKQVILNHHSNTPDKDWCCHIDNESMETIGCADIQYVHELQHLLKLCNVNIVIEV